MLKDGPTPIFAEEPELNVEDVPNEFPVLLLSDCVFVVPSLLDLLVEREVPLLTPSLVPLLLLTE